MFFMAFSLSCQANDYHLSTHILNSSKGMPAPGVTVELYKYDKSNSNWEMLARKQTKESGRINTFLEG